jgi:tyrosyl-tRNA synthetase
MRQPMTTQPDFLAELTWRGLASEQSQGLVERLRRGPISGYIGFDASATSLHVGHLLQVFLLTHLQRGGGRPVVVIGGATGMIGDPSGKSGERRLLDDDAIRANAAAMRGQLEHFVDFSAGSGQAVMFDNRDWLGRYTMLEFLRQIGKHFPVPYMLSKDSVRQRLEAGMTFTEFSYMTLQAADFLHLHREQGVDLQMGGADQWGNITAGLELIRRVEERDEGAEPSAFALCSPLLLTRDGQKMGKSERGAVFLDPSLTSPYEFYQYWLNDDDALIGDHLRWLTLMDREQVEAIVAEQGAHPERRPAQRALAIDLTARVHGRDEADRQVRAAEAAFSGAPVDDPAVLDLLYREVGGFRVDAELATADALALAVASGLFPSRGEARRSIAQGAFSVNGRRMAAADETLPQAIPPGYWLVRAGRKRLAVGRSAALAGENMRLRADPT